jgi:hypothetical protein
MQIEYWHRCVSTENYEFSETTIVEKIPETKCEHSMPAVDSFCAILWGMYLSHSARMKMPLVLKTKKAVSIVFFQESPFPKRAKVDTM